MALSQQSCWLVLLPSAAFRSCLAEPGGELGRSPEPRRSPGATDRGARAPHFHSPVGLGGQGGIRTGGGRQAGAAEPGRLQSSLQKPKRRRRRARGRGDKGDWPWGAGRGARATRPRLGASRPRGGVLHRGHSRRRRCRRAALARWASGLRLPRVPSLTPFTRELRRVDRGDAPAARASHAPELGARHVTRGR